MEINDLVWRRISILLSIQRALLGAITPRLRAVSVTWDKNSMVLYFFYDGPISEYDQEESECAATEVLSDFPDDNVETRHIRCDYPQRPPYQGHGAVAYVRHEIT